MPADIPAKPIVTIPLLIKNGALVPDHYLGDIQFRIPGKDEPLKIPLEINVRDGLPPNRVSTQPGVQC
jgi:hypothetical protein